MTIRTTDALLNSVEFSNHFHWNDTKPFELMVHITSQSLLGTTEYQEWMKRFGTQTSHIILNEDTAACQGHSNIRNRLDLRLCNSDPVLFPMAAINKEKSPLTRRLPENYFEGESGLEYHFYPTKQKGIKKDNIYKPNFKRKFKDNNLEVELRLHSSFDRLSEEQKTDYYNTCVTFLGTAATKQSKMRGTSSILVELR